eukprot:TRINITY_DN35691_c0_g1_i1.p1 TRINITY_DN35691_c0_g1~~TRINITY_DN35691_c0_g1_i1.p1  ORF type:complete len:576 (+),score=157.22 TRINITY_DN35691_c0_g1_i1:52-1779(+)
MEVDDDDATSDSRSGTQAYVWGVTMPGKVERKRQLTFPTQMPDFAGLGVEPVAVVSGDFHTMILASSGKVYGWGRNNRGQLGLDQRKVPFANHWVEVRALGATVRQIACGGQHTLVLRDSGVVHAFGSNENGQLGVHKRFTERWHPMPVAKLFNVTQIAAGGNCSYALDREGDVYSWGSVRDGSLGHGTFGLVMPDVGKEYYLDVTRPTKIEFFEEIGDVVEEIAAGSRHLLARSGRQLYACGCNENGQLGTGKCIERCEPTPVNLPDVEADGVPSIACGHRSCIAITARDPARPKSAKVWVWGQVRQTAADSPNNLEPELEQSLMDEGVVEVAAGDSFFLSRTSDGRVHTWGFNSVNTCLGHLGEQVEARKGVQQMVLFQGRYVTHVTCARHYCIAVVDQSRSEVADPVIRVPVVGRFSRRRERLSASDDGWPFERRRKLFQLGVEQGRPVDTCSEASDDGVSRLKQGASSLRSGDELSVWMGDVWAWAKVARPPKAGWPAAERPKEGTQRVVWMREDWPEAADLELLSDDETSDEGNPNRWLPGHEVFFGSESEAEEDEEAEVMAEDEGAEGE